jgi:uncharacterized membrane protein
MLDYAIFFLIVFILGVLPSIYYIRNYSIIKKENEAKGKKRINKNIIYLTIILTILNLVYFILFQNEKDLNTFIFLPILFILLGGFIELRFIVYFLLIYNIFISFVYLKVYL